VQRPTDPVRGTAHGSNRLHASILVLTPSSRLLQHAQFSLVEPCFSSVRQILRIYFGGVILFCKSSKLLEFFLCVPLEQRKFEWNDSKDFRGYFT
jgi:hypothetical protein